MDPDRELPKREQPDFVEGEIPHEQFENTDFEPLGVETHPLTDPGDDAPVREEREVTVSDLAQDGFRFFTTALIITHGLFDRDPLVEFSRQAAPDAAEDEFPFAVDCQFPFFQNIGQSVVNDQLINWDHRLYGIPEHNWAACENFIKAIAMFDAERYHYAKIGSHLLTIVDPTMLHSGKVITELPTVDITVFCVSGYRNFVWMAPATDPPRTQPFPKVDPPMSGIKAEAEAILGPPPSPEQVGKFNGPDDRSTP